MSIYDIHPYAEHQGHEINLAGTHRGNRFCVTCRVRVGEPEFDADQASASVPVAGIIVGEAATRAFADRMRLRAYLTRAESPTGMQLTRAFRATVKGFNADYGQACRNWADVARVARELMKGDQA